MSPNIHAIYYSLSDKTMAEFQKINLKVLIFNHSQIRRNINKKRKDANQLNTHLPGTILGSIPTMFHIINRINPLLNQTVKI